MNHSKKFNQCYFNGELETESDVKNNVCLCRQFENVAKDYVMCEIINATLCVVKTVLCIRLYNSSS